MLRTGLDVSLLNKSVQVPLKVTLNEVQAPASAKKTALSVNVDGVEGGAPVSVLRADVATANATADEHRAEGYTNLAKASIHVPGLPVLSLIEVEKVTSKAVCETGRKPVAESNVLGHVAVLGKKVTLSMRRTDPGGGAGRRRGLPRPVQDGHHRAHGGRDGAPAQGVGQPAESQRRRGGGRGHPRRGDLRDPEGAEDPEEPGSTNGGSTGGDSGGGSTGGDSGTSGGDVKTQTGSDTGTAPTGANLAETGGSSATPYIAGGAALLLAVGAGATVLTRRRAYSQG